MPKFNTENTTVENAVSSAFSIIDDLASEVREVVDNASGTNFENTQRIQTLSETADTLEQHSEPSAPGSVSDIEVTVSLLVKRRQSRGDRRDEACAYLAAVIDTLREDHEEDANASDFADELESIQGDWEGAEFPGMYG